MEVVKHSRKVELLSKLLRIVTSSSRKFIYCKCAEEKLGMPLLAYGADRVFIFRVENQTLQEVIWKLE